MVKEYLENYLDELLTKKIDLEREYSHLKNQILENEAFIKLLNEKNDLNYESFTPRVVHSSNKKKIEEMKQQESELQLQLDAKQKEVLQYASKIEELNRMIKMAAELEAVTEKGNQNQDDNEFSRLKYLEIQETERQRIARELHDSSIQNLTGMVHKAELCSKLMDIDPTRCKTELDALSNTIKATINEMRGLIYDLRPMSFDDIGFDAAVERELERIQRSGSAKIQYYSEGSNEKVRPVVGITLLRVIQEACNNAMKHAEASVITVRISYEEERILLSIEDDGKGFTVDEKQSPNDLNGFGLPIMRERIFLLSGKIEIHSEIGQGTEIHIIVPIIES